MSSPGKFGAMKLATLIALVLLSLGRGAEVGKEPPGEHGA
jgi:hypothetical protein